MNASIGISWAAHPSTERSDLRDGRDGHASAKPGQHERDGRDEIARLQSSSYYVDSAQSSQPRYNHGTTETPRPLVALFEGVSGTGKTLAAHWLATSIGSVVRRVDLGHVVSKYVGETERNLDRIFGSARACSAVLLLDEADALLGRRTEVHDSHDRYANTETGLLLQRLERHDGVTILTTNAATRIDPSLQDRANAVVVAFPLPPR